MSAEQMEKLKKILQLEQHPEGNQFRQVWRGDREMNFVNKTQHDGPRSVGSSIHTLLTSPDFVSWHRVLSDEIYFWHAGGVMKVHLLDDKGNHSHVLLGDVLKKVNTLSELQQSDRHHTHQCRMIDSCQPSP